jgi:hypothetical protein
MGAAKVWRTRAGGTINEWRVVSKTAAHQELCAASPTFERPFEITTV